MDFLIEEIPPLTAVSAINLKISKPPFPRFGDWRLDQHSSRGASFMHTILIVDDYPSCLDFLKSNLSDLQTCHGSEA